MWRSLIHVYRIVCRKDSRLGSLTKIYKGSLSLGLFTKIFKDLSSLNFFWWQSVLFVITIYTYHIIFFRPQPTITARWWNLSSPSWSSSWPQRPPLPRRTIHKQPRVASSLTRTPWPRLFCLWPSLPLRRTSWSDRLGAVVGVTELYLTGHAGAEASAATLAADGCVVSAVSESIEDASSCRLPYFDMSTTFEM